MDRYPLEPRYVLAWMGAAEILHPDRPGRWTPLTELAAHQMISEANYWSVNELTAVLLSLCEAGQVEETQIEDRYCYRLTAPQVPQEG